jgi:hypothetical protein
VTPLLAFSCLLTANAVPLMLLAGLLEQNRAEHRALVDMEQQTRAMLRALPRHGCFCTRLTGSSCGRIRIPSTTVSKAIGVRPRISRRR